jgi:hypothetical protein
MAVPPIAYDLVQDSHTADRVRHRFALPISRLTKIGFGEVCIYRETGPAYSALTAFPVTLLMLLRREVLAMMPPWRLSGAFPLLIRTTPPTYAYPFGLGVKFHTRFEDGTALVTATFASQLVPATPSPLRKQARRMSVEAGWDWHREGVEALVRDGRCTDLNLGFLGFVEVCRLEDQAGI